MVPLDGSELAKCVLPHVEAITSGYRVTNVVLVRVIDPIQLPASVSALLRMCVNGYDCF